MLNRKTDTNYYMSKRRYILQVWNDYVKSEQHACKSIKNAMEKYLWNIGLKAIKNNSNDVKKDTTMDKTLNSFWRKFMKRACGNAFSKWREGTHK
jgi:hypothetical protein